MFGISKRGVDSPPDTTANERALIGALIALAVTAGIVAFGSSHKFSVTLSSVIGVAAS